ncbi:MAG: ATPase, T2SS/T4P/T4SS family [Candidatus Gygaella obscura]|nr:ATPase, T2SS/T4P/T4SS family [Candidatus Gygaella obscura]
MDRCKVISLFSTKGGVGKTFLAVNIAVSLVKDFDARVALLDLDLHVPGDMARMLDIVPERPLAEYMSLYKKRPDDQKPDIKDFVITHGSGVDFVSGLLKPRQASHFFPELIKVAVDELSKKYDYIIIDAGKIFSDTLLATLNTSNLIMMVITPDIISVYQTKWALDMLQSLHLPLKMIKCVLNRSQSLGSVAWEEIKSILPVDIISYMPSEGKAVGLSVNKRIPVILDSPRSKIAQSIKELCEKFAYGEDIFISRQEIEDINLTAYEQITKHEDFWRQQNLAEPIKETKELDEITELKKRVHHRLISELDLKHLNLTLMDANQARLLREKTERSVANALTDETGGLVSSDSVRKRLIKEITDEALGLGPLEDLISDLTISDILVNGKDQIYVERHGKLELTSKRFISNDQVRQVIERIIAPLGRRIDESVPMVDARLVDGSRVNAIIPPLSLSGPVLSIRKFGAEKFGIDDLIKIKSLNENMRDFINACVLTRRNIIVSGGTGSGKTTVLNILSAFIPITERILTIEDAAELKLKQEHWVRLESRPSNIEGKGSVSIRELFRNSLRMRPDRIIIGECRGAETLDMLQAMNTGHDGSLTTIHANSPRDVLTRLDSMILMSGVELPIRAIREMIASAINVIIHTARLSDGSRKVIRISEITGMEDEIHIDIKDIFIFRQTGIGEDGQIQGYFEPTGNVPSFMDIIDVSGFPINREIFKKNK